MRRPSVPEMREPEPEPYRRRGRIRDDKRVESPDCPFEVNNAGIGFGQAERHERQSTVVHTIACRAADRKRRLPFKLAQVVDALDASERIAQRTGDIIVLRG